MITDLGNEHLGGLKQLVGKSSDSKPTNVEENSLFLELDTNKLYYFSDGAWTELGE